MLRRFKIEEDDLDLLDRAYCNAYEPEFKREKSIGGLDRLPNFRDDTVASWVAGKRLSFALARQSVEGAFSPCGSGERIDAVAALAALAA